MGKLLVIDDKADEFRKALDVALEEHTILYASEAQEGLSALEREPGISCVLLDIGMPARLGRRDEEEGLAVLQEIRKRWPALPVIMLTGHRDSQDIIRAFKLGAFHYLLKPPDVDSLRTFVQAAIEHHELGRRVVALEETIRIRDELESAPAPAGSFGSMVGHSAAMRAQFGKIAKAAHTDASVLLLGETGTGKELAAREIHARSRRAAKELFPINCAAIPRELLEGELFGHKKGAFTSSTETRLGVLRAADGGTVLLDEITEMSAELQSKLLRAVESKAVRPVGEDREVPVDVRLIAATNQDIDARVREEKFRKDLFYRLNVVRIVLPPLRERREDIRPLAEHFLAKHGQGREFFLSEDALRALEQRPWHGNARELEHAIEQALTFADGPELKPEDFPEPDESAGPAAHSIEALWGAVLNGHASKDINRFAEIHGKAALAEMIRRAGERTRTDREAGRLLGFIPEDDPGDRAFNNFRSWKRRVFRLRDDLREAGA